MTLLEAQVPQLVPGTMDGTCTTFKPCNLIHVSSILLSASLTRPNCKTSSNSPATVASSINPTILTLSIQRTRHSAANAQLPYSAADASVQAIARINGQLATCDPMHPERLPHGPDRHPSSNGDGKSNRLLREGRVRGRESRYNHHPIWDRG